MLFYRDAQRMRCSRSQPYSRTVGTLWTGGDAGDSLRVAWMFKCFLMGITLLALSYCVIQISGIYYRSSALTACTISAFLFISIIWYNHQKHRRSHQITSVINREEPVVMSISEFVAPTPPPPFSAIYKHDTSVPPRDCTPPPSYQEAVLAMMLMNPLQDHLITPPSPSPPPPPPPPPPPLPPPISQAQKHLLPQYIDMGVV